MNIQLEAEHLLFIVGTLVALGLLLIVLFAIRRGAQPRSADGLRGLLDAQEERQNLSRANDLRLLREEFSAAWALNRQELSTTLLQFQSSMQARLEALLKAQAELSENTVRSLFEARNGISESVARGLKELQERNEAKLEQMRKTVDEKLHESLENRLNKSFDLVSKQLLEVQRGLGQMQSLAQDVGGLKKALTNVKVRGMLGEAQLQSLLEQFLAPGQYLENTPVRPLSRERVEFAVRLPGMEDDEPVLLPIDSKFPIEDYQRLQDALELGEKAAMDEAGKAFETRLRQHAKDIADKYIAVPHTTDFAIMFLPFESLYAEAVRRDSLFQHINRELKIVICGPANLAALLSSLQVGFKTMAISKESAKVWKILGAVRGEFAKFGGALQNVQKSLQSATNNLGKVSSRARQMERKLQAVELLDEGESRTLLAIEDDAEYEADMELDA